MGSWTSQVNNAWHSLSSGATGMSLQHLMLAPLWRESSSCSDTCTCCVMLHHCCLLFRLTMVPGRVVSFYRHCYKVFRSNKRARGRILGYRVLLSARGDGIFNSILYYLEGAITAITSEEL